MLGGVSIEIETVGAAGLEVAQEVFRTAMVGLAARPGPLERFYEPGRTVLARVDGTAAGTATAFASRVAVPGGALVPQAAVTRVGVLPTFARRGVLTALMRHQLVEVAGRGEPVATLRATQGGIYERFGYGVATWWAGMALDTRVARLRDTVPASGPVRYADPVEAVDRTERIHAAVGPVRPGEIDRYRPWWEMRRLPDSEVVHTVLHGEPGAEDGYLRYRPAGADWPRSSPRAIVVDDLFAATPAALLGLLRHLLALDIVDRVEFTGVPVDFPLRHLLTDPRAVTVTSVRDETWLRLTDVPAALGLRGYRAAEPVVLEVGDPLLPANSGRYRIAADGVTRTDAAPDLTAPVSSIAATYLGGARWPDLVLAGRAGEHRPGAAAAADSLFATDIPPFSGTWF